MCNMGPGGWQLGRIIALRYREDDWDVDKEAPYQVAIDSDHSLIYVPEDDIRYCREPTPYDLRIAHRLDALAALPSTEGVEVHLMGQDLMAEEARLACFGGELKHGSDGYRSGRCHCCDSCPRNWSSAELYSEHYRCAERNGLKVTRHALDLGVVSVGQRIDLPTPEELPFREGFLQCPTMVRLPPGVRFSDDATLGGEVCFDPHRAAEYRVEFVAVSTVGWEGSGVGIVRLEIAFSVVGNEAPSGFARSAFLQQQQTARDLATRTHAELLNVWERWEDGELENNDTCDRMLAKLRQLRELCERHPRLDSGRWWALLGGYHMNVHKLLENALFECELYLGHALTFGDAEIRRQAEQNLEGCYQKRLLEAARFMWLDGVQLMMRGKWAEAAEILRLAAAKKDGWGWAVNHGDIWLSESAARFVHGAELDAQEGAGGSAGAEWIAEASKLLKKCQARAGESGTF